MDRTRGPIIHLNGTSKNELLDQQQKLYLAIADAMKALANAAPNQRDYYLLDEAAWARARAKYDVRYNTLKLMQTDVQDDMLFIANQ
jgi:hypothetical protein